MGESDLFDTPHDELVLSAVRKTFISDFVALAAFVAERPGPDQLEVVQWIGFFYGIYYFW